MVDVHTNLLKNRHTLSEKDYQKERAWLLRSVTGLVVVVILVVAVAIWNFVVTQQLTTTEKVIAKTAKEMEGLTEASAQQVYLKSRLNLVTGFLSSRSNVRESLQKILATNVGGAHISAMSFEDESTVSLQYSANTVGGLDELLNYYKADTNYYTQVVSRGVSHNKEGIYQMTLALVLPKDIK